LRLDAKVESLDFILLKQKKKVVLITGCDSGFGYSLARHVAEQHLTIILVACCFCMDSEGAKDLISKGITVFNLDVTNNDSIDKLKEDIGVLLKEKNGELWALVNNAATLVFADAIFQTSDMVKNQLDVNFLGCWRMSQVFSPHLIESKGRLVNMISYCTECPLPTLSIYTATKAALFSLSNGMRMELAKYDVKVILFNPGDHPGETPLCFGQGAKYEAMQEGVTLRFSKHTKVLKDFENHKEKFVNTFPGMPALKKLDSPGLYKAFDKIIMDVRPKKFYINSPIKTRSFFGFLSCIPWAWSDKARSALMRLPK